MKIVKKDHPLSEEMSSKDDNDATLEKNYCF